MTDKEKAIVMAYTGVCMLEGEKLSIFYEYIESICERPIYTHELADKSYLEEIKEKSKKDFIDLCRSEDLFERGLEIIRKHAGHGGSDDYCDGYDVAWLEIKQEFLALKGEG